MSAAAAESLPTTVDDAEDLHRVLNPGSNAIVDGRVHYMAFFMRDHPHEVSVDRARYRSEEATLARRPRAGLARLVAGKVRAAPIEPPMGVVSAPEHEVPDDPSSPMNHAHAHVVIDAKVSKSAVKSKACKALADLAVVVRDFPPVTEVGS